MTEKCSNVYMTRFFPASGPERRLYRKRATGIYVRILLAELQLKSRRPVHAYLAFDAEATASAIVHAAKLEGSACRIKCREDASPRRSCRGDKDLSAEPLTFR